MNSRQFKSNIVEMVDQKIDCVLMKYDFKRYTGSLYYKRKTGEIIHEIAMMYQMPKYSDDPAIVWIGPRYFVYIKSVNQMVQQMEPNRFHFDSHTSLFGGSIGHLMPERNLVTWYPRDTSEMMIHGIEIGNALEQYVVPFLNEYNSIQSIIDGFEKGDNRLDRGSEWILRIAAAYLVLDQKDKAKQILIDNFMPKDAFERLGLRKQYANALKYVGVI